MFASLFSKVGLYAIGALVAVLILIGGYAYIEHQNVTIANLQSSVATLQVTDKAKQLQIDSLVKDMNLVKQAQDAATKAINDASTQAKLAQQQIRSQNLNKAAEQNSGQLQIQLNTGTAQTLTNWENLSK